MKKGKKELGISKHIPHSKDKDIKGLLIEYSKLPKKNNGEGRKIRRRLRRLGYYLSKNKSMSKSISKEKTKTIDKE
jgi:hypothetical protein